MAFLFGGRGPWLSTLSESAPFPHDIVRFFPKTKDHIFEVCARLYEQGYTLRELAARTGFAKTSIRELLISRGLPMRQLKKSQPGSKRRTVKCRSSIPPYGYTWLEAQLVKEPTEYKIVLKILDLWRSGRTLRAIAKYLNDHQISVRRGQRWHHETVNQIILRHSNETKKPKREIQHA